MGQLMKSIGNESQKVLTSQLRDMEKNGLVVRKVYDEVPPGVEYLLMDLGRSLKPILDAMAVGQKITSIAECLAGTKLCT